MTHRRGEPVINGPRLTLARFHEGDLDAVHAFASDPVVCQFTTWGPSTIEDTRAFLVEATQPTSDGHQVAVLLDDQVIGSAAVWTTSPQDRSGELGYTIHRDCWGRGYATEVANLLLQLGFERLGLERIAATCAPENAGSARVLEKVGFRREGLLRGHVLVRGTRRDSLLFGRLRTDSVCG
jgi:RimJ/RimL family protein N-acetyltransferase